MDKTNVYFHSGDYIPKTTFTAFPCKHSEIYVTGLENNNVYLEDSRGLRIYRDEQVFLSTDNTHFNVYSLLNDLYIGKLQIYWDTSCTLNTEPYLEEVTTFTVTNHSSIITTKKTTSTRIESSNKDKSTLLHLNTSSTYSSSYEIIEHMPLVNVYKNESKMNSMYISLVLIITIVLCVILIVQLRKGDSNK